MPNKCLILLTNYFPYHKGEEYLESEIFYLSKVFKKIIIIPTMVSEDMKVSRQVPENCEIFPVCNDMSILGKLRVFSKYFVLRKKPSFYSSEEKGIKKLFSLYFETRSQNNIEKIKQSLDKEYLKSYSDIVIYAYWFYVTARVAVGIRNEVIENDSHVYTFSRAHGYDIFPEANSLNFLPQRKYLLEQLDNVFPVSEYAVRKLHHTFPQFADKVASRALGTLPIDAKWKKTPENKTVIVSCSMIRKLKRLDLLIDALVLLENNRIPYHWVHFGSGQIEADIHRQAKELLNQKNYTFMGHVPNSEIRHWYEENSASFFINLSTSEGVPVSIMEAQSVGLPVIATDVGGTSEIVEDGVNGYLLKSDVISPQIVFEKLVEFINLSLSEKQAFSQASYRIWDEKFNAKKNYDRFAKEIAQ